MSIKLYNVLKDRCATHRNRVKICGDIMHDDVIGDNVNHMLALHCHILTYNRIPKG